MKINLLGILVGNSRTRLGTLVEGKVTDTFALNNESLDGKLDEALERAFTPLRATEQAAVLMSWSNAAIGEHIYQRARKSLGETILRIERDLPIPIGRQLDREAIVGEDRLLNAAAAYDTLKEACVVVDAGTAITIDFVDGAGTFHGGAIGPGARLMLDSLHDRIPHLPEVEVAAPAESIGHNTSQAMLDAMFYGLRGMVRELTEQYAAVAGNYPMVIATGGDSDLLFHNWEMVDRIVPDLTLMGMAVTYRAALEQQA
jgi:type III pantothenate kinase